MAEVIALVKDGFALVSGQGVAEAVAEVEFGGVAAALAEVAEGLSGDLGLRLRHGFDDDSRILDHLIQLGAHDRVAAAIEHNRCLQIRCRRHAQTVGNPHASRQSCPVRFALDYCDQCR